MSGLRRQNSDYDVESDCCNMADCDFCNLGDCVRRNAVKKLETVFALTIRVLVYACAIAGGVTCGIGFADYITYDGEGYE